MCGVDAVQQLGPGGTLPPPGFAAQLARGLLQRPSVCRLLHLLVVVVVVAVAVAVVVVVVNDVVHDVVVVFVVNDVVVVFVVV